MALDALKYFLLRESSFKHEGLGGAPQRRSREMPRSSRAPCLEQEKKTSLVPDGKVPSPPLDVDLAEQVTDLVAAVDYFILCFDIQEAKTKN